jgi:hypothetical protein
VRVTLNGINRVGTESWKGRKKWSGKPVRIWSAQWNKYWRPDAQGYTTKPDEALVVPFEEAYRLTWHCGCEKQIVYERVK